MDLNPKLLISSLMNSFGSEVVTRDEDHAAATVFRRSLIEAIGDDRIERLHDPGAGRQGGYHFARASVPQAGQHELGASTR